MGATAGTLRERLCFKPQPMHVIMMGSDQPPQSTTEERDGKQEELYVVRKTSFALSKCVEIYLCQIEALFVAGSQAVNHLWFCG